MYRLRKQEVWLSRKQKKALTFTTTRLGCFLIVLSTQQRVFRSGQQCFCCFFPAEQSVLPAVKRVIRWRKSKSSSFHLPLNVSQALLRCAVSKLTVYLRINVSLHFVCVCVSVFPLHHQRPFYRIWAMCLKNKRPRCFFFLSCWNNVSGIRNWEQLFLFSHAALKLFKFNELQHWRYHTLAHISI